MLGSGGAVGSLTLLGASMHRAVLSINKFHLLVAFGVDLRVGNGVSRDVPYCRELSAGLALLLAETNRFPWQLVSLVTVPKCGDVKWHIRWARCSYAETEYLPTVCMIVCKWFKRRGLRVMWTEWRVFGPCTATNLGDIDLDDRPESGDGRMGCLQPHVERICMECRACIWLEFG